MPLGKVTKVRHHVQHATDRLQRHCAKAYVRLTLWHMPRQARAAACRQRTVGLGLDHLHVRNHNNVALL